MALYAYFRPGEEREPEIRITQLSRNQIDRVRVERPNSDIEMEKRNGNWHMLRPYQTRVDQLKIDRLLDIGTATASDQFPLENLSRFGLDAAPVRVTLNDEAFSFGSINDITNEQYLSGADSVFLIRTYFGYGIPVDATKLVSRKILGDDESPVAFDFGDWQARKTDKGGWSMLGEEPSKGEGALSADTLNECVAGGKWASRRSASPHEGSVRGKPIVVQFSNGDSATFRILSRGVLGQLRRGG